MVVSLELSETVAHQLLDLPEAERGLLVSDAIEQVLQTRRQRRDLPSLPAPGFDAVAVHARRLREAAGDERTGGEVLAEQRHGEAKAREQKLRGHQSEEVHP